MKYLFVAALDRMAAVADQRKRFAQIKLTFAKRLAHHLNNLFIHQVSYQVFNRVPTLLESLKESPGFFLGTISRSWKVLENGFGPGKSGNLSARSWKVLEFSRL